MENCKPVATPVDVGLKLSKDVEGERYVETTYYQSTIGVSVNEDTP